jgi:hypothetical protein
VARPRRWCDSTSPSTCHAPDPRAKFYVSLAVPVRRSGWSGQERPVAIRTSGSDPPAIAQQGASFSSAVDATARILAGLSLVLALTSICVTYLLWFRSGPKLTVNAFVRAETSSLHIEVASTGRLTATLREVELRDYFVLRGRSALVTGEVTTHPVSRWSVPVTVRRAGAVQTLPVDLPPTAFVEGDVNVKEVLAMQAGAFEVNVNAWAQRGDRKAYSSATVRVK